VGAHQGGPPHRARERSLVRILPKIYSVGTLY
jgi:hypothetical protein